MEYIGLKSKSSHTIKYSQPFELVCFHIIHVRIKCHKGSHYPHLLINYFFNSLIFSGLTCIDWDQMKVKVSTNVM